MIGTRTTTATTTTPSRPPTPRDTSGGEHVIGSGGDFITAPEVSQLFGESLLVWLTTQYRMMNGPSEIQLVEIGPGKGTLICETSCEAPSGHFPTSRRR